MRPDAKTSVSLGLPAPPLGRSTLMRPDRLSATNTSPFGATRIARGPARPLAKIWTAKPGGALRWAPSGRRMTRTTLSADALELGGGMSPARMCLHTPGASVRQSPNAALPLRGARISADCATKRPGMRAEQRTKTATTATQRRQIINTLQLGPRYISIGRLDYSPGASWLPAPGATRFPPQTRLLQRRKRSR